MSGQYRKGLVEEREDDLAAARREAGDELGVTIVLRSDRLGEYRQQGGKIVIAGQLRLTSMSRRSKVTPSRTSSNRPMTGTETSVPVFDWRMVKKPPRTC